MIRKHIPEPIKEKYRRMRASVLSLDLSKSKLFPQPEEELLASQDISMIVSIHDAPELTLRCLSSLEDYGGNAEIILVNDASQLEETVNLIRDFQQRNGWQVINHDEVLGHSRSCKDGSGLATRPYLCLLNSDTVVTPHSWWAAKEAFDLEPRIAVTGPSTSWARSKQAVPRAEYCRHYWTNNQIYAFAQKYVSKRPQRSWVDQPEVMGFAFFIRRNLWDQLGGFDQNLPDYGNETELCKRLLRSGYRVVWTPNSYIHHFGQSSYGRKGQEEISRRRLAAQAYIRSLNNTKD